MVENGMSFGKIIILIDQYLFEMNTNQKFFIMINN